MHIALMTEFSFKKSFLHMSDIHKYVIDGRVGIADVNNTYGHIPLAREAKKHGFTPIFGVRLSVLANRDQRICNMQWIFIAKNNDGLKELYELVSTAYEQFYYIPRLTPDDVKLLSDNIVSIAPCTTKGKTFVAYGQGYSNDENVAKISMPVAIDQNNYAEKSDSEVYQLLAGTRKNGNEYNHMFSSCTYPQHILSREEYLFEYGEYGDDPLKAASFIGSNCNASIPDAEMVKWSGTRDIHRECMKGAGKVNYWSNEYKERLDYEIKLIEEKDYIDYFMIVADLVSSCKRNMIVGPARGSSAGSLVCYLLHITEVDPIEHKLIFERFIDVNRFDLPDIDIDFPDTKRESAIEYLKKKYGKDKVMCLSNINRLKAKSAIGEFAKGLGIPPYETDEVKDAIIERSSGDARAAMCIADTFETTEPGKKFIEKYPAMKLVSRIENHASHAGKHAAGILVSTLPLCNYGSLNSRDDVIMMDKIDAEGLNLLKVDCLGLRTLSILEGVCEQINKTYDFFYDLPLDDSPTYELFNSLRLSGIFQFEGQALQMIVKQMGVKDFNDISAITALARPGALNSGGTARYIKYSTEDDVPAYYSDTHRDITGDTFGIVVYQEQMMEIARRIGGLSWADTSTLRRAASKSLGDEFFGKFKEQFIEGALENGYSNTDSEQLWSDISASGSWSFNKSHAVSYGLVSYWTAYCKANHPMEFAVASLNNSANVDNARKLLRDMVLNEGMEYVAADPQNSKLEWSTKDGKLIGGLQNIKGIGASKAKAIINARKGGKPLTESLFKTLANPITDFDIIFPCKHYWGGLFTDPISYQLDGKPVEISTIDGKGRYIFIGCLVDRNIRDLNEHIFLTKRNMEVIENHTLYLNFKLEDDTDMISCKIGRYKYESIGRDIAEKGKIGKSWYVVQGKINSDWRRVDVDEIICLNDYFPNGIGNGVPK